MNGNQILEKLDLPEENRKAILSFFVIWSRFECALKRCEYAKGRGKNKAKKSSVEVDWDKLYNRLNEKYEETTLNEFQKVCDYLIKHPPKRQMYSPDGTMKWETVTNTSLPLKASNIIILAKNVRNNMFHGGKYESPVIDVCRDLKLITCSISAIKFVLDNDRDLRNNFYESDEIIVSKKL